MTPKTRHNATLDGLRGVAALSIVMLHLSMGKSLGSLPYRGYLAVDFFFLLSGFVLAKAYELRLRSDMGVFAFMRIRLMRLYPLIFLGMLAGAAAVLFDMAKGLRGGGNLAQLIYMFLCSLILFPAFGYDNTTVDFPLDSAAWSLMFELLVNLVYSVFAKLLNSRLLSCIVILAGVVLVVLSYSNNGLDIGPLKTEVPDGAVRVVFSFGLGILVFRGVEAGLFHWVPRVSGLALAFLLVLSFVPRAMSVGWLYDMFCVMVVYPAIIICGASDDLPSRCVPAALWAGRLSYPIYALHLPVVVQHFGRFNHWRGLHLLLAMVIAMSVAVIVALGALKLYDEPIQKRLSTYKKTAKM